MLNKIVSLTVLIGLIATSNLSILAQTQSYKTENSQQISSLSKKEFSDKLGINSGDRARELLDKDSSIKVKKNSITAKTMQDDDKARQKKKFVGLNTTTAVIIGAVLVTAIVIVLVAKGNDDDRNENFPCSQFPCR